MVYFVVKVIPIKTISGKCHKKKLKALYQELIMWRGEYLTLYSPVIYDCAEVKWLPFRVT